jgi:hypothetical protein
LGERVQQSPPFHFSVQQPCPQAEGGNPSPVLKMKRMEWVTKLNCLRQGFDDGQACECE